MKWQHLLECRFRPKPPHTKICIQDAVGQNKLQADRTSVCIEGRKRTALAPGPFDWPFSVLTFTVLSKAAQSFVIRGRPPLLPSPKRRNIFCPRPKNVLKIIKNFFYLKTKEIFFVWQMMPPFSSSLTFCGRRKQSENSYYLDNNKTRKRIEQEINNKKYKRNHSLIIQLHFLSFPLSPTDTIPLYQLDCLPPFYLFFSSSLYTEFSSPAQGSRAFLELGITLALKKTPLETSRKFLRYFPRFFFSDKKGAIDKNHDIFPVSCRNMTRENNTVISRHLFVDCWDATMRKFQGQLLT